MESETEKLEREGPICSKNKKKCSTRRSGCSTATTRAFFARRTPVPDELRVVVASLAPTSSVYVRVLTAGTSSDVHDYHSPALLASKVIATVTDEQGDVAATLVEVASVTVSTGTYAAYKLTLARVVTPTEIGGISVRGSGTVVRVGARVKFFCVYFSGSWA